MKGFLKYYVEKNKDPSLILIPEMVTVFVLIGVVVGLFVIYPMFFIIVVVSALIWYWVKAFKDYKASKEKQDE